MTTTGGVSDARATIRAEIDAAAPRPLPAERAIALLHDVEEPDVAALGALAYEALTGVAPGEPPIPPTDLVPGFPPFASEVLMRAMTAAEDRRPTSQAMLVVLETVPPSAWPAPRDVPASAVAGPVGDQPAGEDPVGDERIVDGPGAVVRAAEGDPDDEFRGIVGVRHAVPRFEPLEGAGDLPLPTVRRRRRRRSSSRRRHQHTVASAPQVAPDPQPAAVPHATAPAEPEPDPAPALETERGTRREARREARRQRATERAAQREQERRSRERDPARGPAGEARDQTLVLVGVLIVLIVLGVLYAMNRDEGTASQAPPAEGAGHALVLAPTA